MTVGVLMVGSVVEPGLLKVPYTNDTAPVASDFIATNMRSDVGIGYSRFQSRYHCVLGGASGTLCGAICIVKTSFCEPSLKYGSAMETALIFTRASGGTCVEASKSSP